MGTGSPTTFAALPLTLQDNLAVTLYRYGLPRRIDLVKLRVKAPTPAVTQARSVGNRIRRRRRRRLLSNHTCRNLALLSHHA